MVTRQLFTIAIFVVFAAAKPAAAEFKYLESDPIGIPTKTPTAVTFVTEIPTNPKLLKQSVNLLRQTPLGLKVVGTLRDDGLAGDRLANDNLYSLQVTLDEIDAGQIVFQASAAYKGVLKRDLSVPYALSVYPTAEQILYLTPPSHNPSALSFTLNNVEDVTFSSRTTGTANPPAVLELWELDAKGQRISPALGQLRDDGQSGDLAAGDYLYSGTFPVNTGVEGERRHQVTAVYQGGIVASPVGALTITHHPIGPAAINPADAIQDPVTGQEFAPGELLVKFQAGLTPQQIDSILRSLNAIIIGSLPDIRVLEVNVPGASDTNKLKQVMTQFNALPQVIFAEPNGVLYTGAALPDKTCDPNNSSDCDWAAIKVRADSLWPDFEGEGVTVAVVDTGVNSNDPDLAGAVLSGFNATNQGSDTTESDGHGTAVSRLIAARRTNTVSVPGIGITGIAPKATIYPIKAYVDNTNRSSLWSFVANGIENAANQGIRVINASWQNNGEKVYFPGTLPSKVAAATYEDANKKGSLVVGIAENKVGDACATGMLAQILSSSGGMVVGGTNSADQRWVDAADGSVGSGYGTCVDIAAPAENICTGPNPNKNYPCGGIANQSPPAFLRAGTSFAAPQVSGAAALIFERYPNMHASEVKRVLKETAVRLQPENTFCPNENDPAIIRNCAGRLDVFAALNSIGPASINVGEGPRRVISGKNLDGSPSNEIYVSNFDGNSVSVINTTTDIEIHRIPVGNQPDALVVSRDGTRVYVGQHGGNISVIDTNTKTLISIPEPGTRPNDPSGPGSGTITEDGTRPNVPIGPTEATPILTGGPVRDLALSPDGHLLYIAMENGGLYWVDTTSNIVTSALATPCPEALVFSKDGSKLYVNYQCAPSPSLGPGHDAIFIFNTVGSFQSAITTLSNGTPIPNVGSSMTISPDGNQIWANGLDACINYNNPGCPIQNAGVINIIRTSDNQVIKTIGFPEGIPSLISFSLDSKRAYIGGARLREFDTTTFTEIVTDFVDPFPASGSLVFTGNKIYAPVPSENAVRVIRN